MNNFKFNIPTKVYFGQGEIKRLPAIIDQYGDKVLLVYGGGSIKRNGLYDEVVNLLKDKEIHELSGVDPNPRIETVREGAQICKDQQIDVILAVGGGSVIDCAKVIAAAAHYQGDAWDLVEDRKLITQATPLVDILTLSATGTEMNANAVTTNFALKEKLGTSGLQLYPRESILDPTYTFTVPANQTIAGSADIMSHTIENYFQHADQAYLTDLISEAVLKTVVKYAPVAIAEPENYEARANLMWASSVALNGHTSFGKGGAWTCHPIEHYLSAYYDITHAVGLAIITPRWMKHILNEKTVDRFVQYAINVWNIDETDDKFAVAEAGIQKTYDFFKENGIPMTLPEVGIDGEYLQEIAEKVAPKLQSAYEVLSADDVLAILENCLTEGI